MLRAVLFDLDGTLADSAPAITAALSQVRADRGAAAVSATMVRRWISLGAPELVRLALGEAAREPQDDLAAFRTALAALPTPPESLYPGVRDLLQRLRAAGLGLAVVTNKPETLARKLLDDVALSDVFAAVVGGDSTAHAKPHPAPLLAALAALGVQCSEAVLVGDSGIDAAAAASLIMPFYLFEGGYGSAECKGHPVAGRFGEPTALLATLLPASLAAA